MITSWPSASRSQDTARVRIRLRRLPLCNDHANALKLYDNYTRSLRSFEALKGGAVGLYTCGPTVYDYQHIGNFRTFLFGRPAPASAGMERLRGYGTS